MALRCCPSTLLPLLRCTECHGPVSDKVHRLACDKCGHSVPVVDGVPRFAPAFDAGFDRRWQAHPEVQATTRSIWQSKVGWGAADLDGRTVLDAGCGVGRFSRIAGDLGAHVIGLDASPWALGGAAKNAPGAALVQADLLDVPLRDGSVDAAFSVGVLHHTADPECAFFEVARTVRRGGGLAVWLYPDYFADDRMRRAAEFLHDITRACPPEALYAACARHATALRALYDAAPDDPLATVLAVSRSQDSSECVSDTFDWHVPAFRSAHTVDEVSGWFAQAGFEVMRTPKPAVTVHGVRRR